MVNPKINESTMNTLQSKYKIAVLGQEGAIQGPIRLSTLVRGDKIKEKFYESRLKKTLEPNDPNVKDMEIEKQNDKVNND